MLAQVWEAESLPGAQAVRWYTSLCVTRKPQCQVAMARVRGSTAQAFVEVMRSVVMASSGGAAEGDVMAEQNSASFPKCWRTRDLN